MSKDLSDFKNKKGAYVIYQYPRPKGKLPKYMQAVSDDVNLAVIETAGVPEGDHCQKQKLYDSVNILAAIMENYNIDWPFRDSVK